jgi:hypothetical protein
MSREIKILVIFYFVSPNHKRGRSTHCPHATNSPAEGAFPSFLLTFFPSFFSADPATIFAPATKVAGFCRLLSHPGVTALCGKSVVVLL